jgi:hypothetical protein
VHCAVVLGTWSYPCMHSDFPPAARYLTFNCTSSYLTYYLTEECWPSVSSLRLPSPVLLLGCFFDCFLSCSPADRPIYISFFLVLLDLPCFPSSPGFLVSCSRSAVLILVLVPYTCYLGQYQGTLRISCFPLRLSGTFGRGEVPYLIPRTYLLLYLFSGHWPMTFRP